MAIRAAIGDVPEDSHSLTADATAHESALLELTTEDAVVDRVAERDDRVQLAIRDNGPGIPEEEAAVLEGEQEIQPLYHGNGMGLWFVYYVMSLSRATV